VKTATKEMGFRMLSILKKSATAEMNAVLLESFAVSFQKLLKRFWKHIQVGGEYSV
jgi:uncharacterized protein YsxB (DUF464 family)